MTPESAEARLARIEEKLDGLYSRLSDRCTTNGTRIASMEKALTRFGERIGKLEADKEQRKGGKAVVMGILAGGAAMGGLLVKLVDWLGGRSG